MHNEPLVLERTFNVSVEKVWQAITQKEQMKHWYFDIDEFKAEEGFEFTFEGGPEDRKYLHRCRVVEVVEGKKLRHSWSYDGFEGVSYVTWELFDEGNKTRLKLTHEDLETFPANNSDFAKENFVIGWTMIIGTLLKNYLEKG